MSKKLSTKVRFKRWRTRARPNLNYGVVLAAGRQMMFYYQQALPQYDVGKAQRCLARFLCLCIASGNNRWVSSYNVDLKCHAQMLHPAPYREDTTRICGSMPPRDNVMNDRTGGGELQRCWEIPMIQ